MSKDLHIETSAHSGTESVENLVAIRRNRFINRYGETDNYLCQMLRWFGSFVWQIEWSGFVGVVQCDVIVVCSRWWCWCDVIYFRFRVKTGFAGLDDFTESNPNQGPI